MVFFHPWYFVKATLWWTICPFTKCDLLLIVFFHLQYDGSIPWVNEYHGWMSQYHGSIPWVNEYHGWMSQYHGSIPWVNEYHGWMSQYHGQIAWVNEYHGWMSLTIPWSNSMGG